MQLTFVWFNYQLMNDWPLRSLFVMSASFMIHFAPYYIMMMDPPSWEHMFSLTIITLLNTKLYHLRDSEKERDEAPVKLYDLHKGSILAISRSNTSSSKLCPIFNGTLTAAAFILFMSMKEIDCVIYIINISITLILLYYK